MESHGQLVRVAPTQHYHYHLVFSNKTESDAYCISIWQTLTARGVTVWQQKKNIPKDSDNWFNEWYPSANASIKIVCFLTVAYLKSIFCMKEFSIAQAKGKLLVVACEPLAQIRAVDSSAYPHASNALAYLEGGGQVIFADSDDVVDEIIKFIPREEQAAPEPGPAPAGATAWPAELAELVSIPSFAACLAGLGVTSLAEFAENVDLEEGHGTMLQQVVTDLPKQPKKARLQRNRAQLALADLILRLRLFEEFQANDTGLLTRVDCERIPVERMQAKVGGPVGDQFDTMDTDKDGHVSFAELYMHVVVSEGEAVPPEEPRPSAVELQAQEAQRAAGSSVPPVLEHHPFVRGCGCKAQADAFMQTLGIDCRHLDSAYDKCYCDQCYPQEAPDTIDNKGPTSYVVPRGWVRFGLNLSGTDKLPPGDDIARVFDEWSVSFHGLKSDRLRSVLESGELKKSGDLLPDGSKLRCRFRNRAQPEPMFYTSPTVRYAGLKFYAEPQTFGDGMAAQIVLQCRQKPHSFFTQSETMGFAQKWPGHRERQFLHTPADTLEWISDQNTDMIGFKTLVPYGLLIRTFRLGDEVWAEGRSYYSPIDSAAWKRMEEDAASSRHAVEPEPEPDLGLAEPSGPTTLSVGSVKATPHGGGGVAGGGQGAATAAQAAKRKKAEPSAEQLHQIGQRLVAAVSRGRLDDIRALLDQGAPVAFTDGRGDDALHHAAMAGRNDVIDLLVSRGADVNTRNDYDRTPLILAAWKGHVSTCSHLLSLGADPTLKNKAGATALDEAKRYGQAECVAVLQAPVFTIYSVIGDNKHKGTPVVEEAMRGLEAQAAAQGVSNWWPTTRKSLEAQLAILHSQGRFGQKEYEGDKVGVRFWNLTQAPIRCQAASPDGELFQGSALDVSGSDERSQPKTRAAMSYPGHSWKIFVRRHSGSEKEIGEHFVVPENAQHVFVCGYNTQVEM